MALRLPVRVEGMEAGSVDNLFEDDRIMRWNRKVVQWALRKVSHLTAKKFAKVVEECPYLPKNDSTFSVVDRFLRKVVVDVDGVPTLKRKALREFLIVVVEHLSVELERQKYIPPTRELLGRAICQVRMWGDVFRDR